MALEVVAYRCRYHLPFKHRFLSFSRLVLSHRRLSPSTCNSFSAHFSRTFPILNSVWTGNSQCLRMERFWSDRAVNKNKEMVQYLYKCGIIRSERVTEVMESIDRALFVPPGTSPYVDSPMQIGYNVTISAPHMHAMCLQLLEEHLKPGMHVLDIGSGSLQPNCGNV